MKKLKVKSEHVMMTNEFGYDLFIAPCKNLRIQTTTNLQEAEKWNNEFDQSKLDYHRIALGYKCLNFVKI